MLNTVLLPPNSAHLLLARLSGKGVLNTAVLQARSNAATLDDAAILVNQALTFI